MTAQLKQTGIFKVKALGWTLLPSQQSLAKALKFEFVVVASLDKGEWISWEGYEEHHVWGAYWVIKADGTVNFPTVDQLLAAGIWTGTFSELAQPPPDVVVQISVKEKPGQDGQMYYEAGWMNPDGYVPSPRESDPNDLAAADEQFGSLLRATAAARAARTPQQAPPKAQAPAPTPTQAAPPAKPAAPTPPASRPAAPRATQAAAAPPRAAATDPLTGVPGGPGPAPRAPAAAPRGNRPPGAPKAPAAPPVAPRAAREGFVWVQNPISGEMEEMEARPGDDGYLDGPGGDFAPQ